MRICSGKYPNIGPFCVSICVIKCAKKYGKYKNIEKTVWKMTQKILPTA